MSEGKAVALTKYTKSVRWFFKPIYNGTPSKLEWLLEYSVGWQVGVTDTDDWGLDMAKVKYRIYNNNTSAWVEFAKDGHFFHYNNQAAEENQYIGCWTKQAFYGVIDTDVAYYISDDELVHVEFSFDCECVTGECEPQTDAGSVTHLSRDADLVTYYNGIVIT